MRQSLLTERLRNDIIGVVLIVLGAILLIAVAMPGDAIVSNWLSDMLHRGFGIGAVVLPLLVMAFGACYFFMGRYEMVMPRIAIGMAFIFVAIITLAGVNAPEAASHPDHLFSSIYLSAYGGYLGNGIAYALINLVGSIIAWVLMLALIVVGLVLIGFSISGLIERLIARHEKPAPEPEFTAPYSRARAIQERDGQMTAEAEGFVPVATATASRGGESGKGKGKGNARGLTRLLRRSGGGSPQETQVLDNGSPAGAGAGAGAGATVALDCDDDVLHGRQKSPAASAGVGVTRRLDGADLLVDDEMAAGDGFDADADLDGQSGAPAGAGSKGAGKGDAPRSDAQAPTLLADSKRNPTPEGDYQLPDPKMLRKSMVRARKGAAEPDFSALAAKLQATLREFNVEADVVGWVHGPTVTLYKVALASGVKVSKVTSLYKDIALAFASNTVRIFSPISGTSLVGIEIPNDARDNVLLGDVLPPSGETPLLVAIGKDVEGNAITADLEKMPHLLIGGTTGSGKSVSINSMIMSVLMRATPDEVRMILVDPKRVELSLYNDIPHLFVPVVTDPHKAASTLAWAVQEMDRRLKLFEEYGARNLAQYNKMASEWIAARECKRIEAAKAAEAAAEAAAAEAAAALADEDQSQGQSQGQGAGYDVAAAEDQPIASGTQASIAADLDDEDDDDEMERLPRIMIVIDELADLMMVAGKEVENSISRIAQLARAAGIHMIVATQRPSTNVITGLIKANITCRIAFNVASGIDSRVILDTTGAEHLIGNGDLLFNTPKFGKPIRVQGCFVGEDEINAVCKFLRKQGKPDYHEDIFATAVPVLDHSSGGSFFGGSAGDDDALLWEAAEIVVSSNLGSTSALQRRLKVGYARAGRIMDMLEDKGIVGPANGSKPRDVLVDEMELENIKALEQNGML